MDTQQLLKRIREIELTDFDSPEEALARANEIGDFLPRLTGENLGYAESVIQQMEPVIFSLRSKSQNHRDQA